MIKIAITNQKGGVGKTTVSVNMSYELSQLGFKVLLVDLDPQANASMTYSSNLTKDSSISKMFLNKDYDVEQLIIPARIQEKIVKDLDLVPSFIDLALTSEQISPTLYKEKILNNHIMKLQHKYDYVIIDCPPNLGVLTINAIFAADMLIIPTFYSKYSLEGISDLLATAKSIKESQPLELFILRNSYDAKNKKTNVFVEDQLTALQPFLLNTLIRRNEAINQSQISDMPVKLFNNKSYGYSDFIAVTKEIVAICEQKNLARAS